jgi:hypothetical protein
MAGYQAIRATCEAVIRLLEQSWDQATMFNGETLGFQVYTTSQFQARPVTTGVSLFLYNVSVNAAQRIPPGRPRLGANPRPRQLPLNLHLLLTPWAAEASLQHDILGWAMRVLEDNAVVSVAALNTPIDTVFESDETIEIVSTALSVEDMLRIWDGIPGDFQLSVPYMARVVRIDSERPVSGGGPVLTRELEMGQVQR